MSNNYGTTNWKTTGHVATGAGRFGLKLLDRDGRGLAWRGVDSPGGEWITVEEYPRCVVDLLSIYTHRELAMFSTTNAAWRGVSSRHIVPHTPCSAGV